jgi:hypothetical protein
MMKMISTKIIISILFLFSATFSINDAHASTEIDLIDQKSCQTAPLSGIWNATTSTCIATSSLRLNPDDSLTVDNSVFSNIILTIIGTLDNDGTVTNSGTITINHGGTIENYGKIINNQKGMIANYGSLVINELGTVINHGGTIENYGKLIHSQQSIITNSGIIKNMCDGTFTSDGDFTGNPVDNVSCMANTKSSTIPEFPLAMPLLVVGVVSSLVLYTVKFTTRF